MSGLVIPTAGTIAGAADTGRLTTPDTGAQAAQLGDQLFRIGSALETDRLNRQLGEARVSMMQGLNDLRLKYAQVGNPDQIDQGFKSDAATLKSQIVDGLDPKIKDQGGMLFDQLAVGDASALGARALTLRQSQQRAIAANTYHATTQAAATADPQTLDSYVQQTKAYYSHLVSQGIFTPEEAQRVTAQLPIDIQSKQAEAQLAADPQGLITKIDAGDFKYLNPSDVTRLRARAENAVAQKTSAVDRQNASILKEATTVINAGRTWQAGGLSETDLENDPAMKANPAFPAFEQALALRAYMPKFTSLPVDQQQAALAEEKTKAASAPYNLKIATAMEASIKQAQTGYSKDPLNYAAQSGAIGPLPALPDPSATPDSTLVAALKARAQTSDYLTQKGYTRANVYFTPEERKAWAPLVNKDADPAERARLAQDFALAYGNDATKAAAELKADPVFSWVGSMLANEGSAQTAQEIFQGQRAIADKDVKLPPVTDRRETYFKTFQGLFDPISGPNGNPVGADETGIRNSVLSAADALYAFRARTDLPNSDTSLPSTANNLAKGKIDATVYTQALHEVLGGTGTTNTAAATGGIETIRNTPTLIPPGIHGADVSTALGNLTGDLSGPGLFSFGAKPAPVTDETWKALSLSGNVPDLGGKPMDATTLRRLHLRAIGGNAYILEDGTPGAANAPVYGSDGKPYVLDVTKLLQGFGPGAYRKALQAPAPAPTAGGATAEPDYYRGVAAAAPGSLAPGMEPFTTSDTGEKMSNATGTFTGKYTQYGRKIWQSQDGSVYSERTITAQAKDGKWYNVPTVAANGQILPEQQVSDWLWGQSDPKDPVTGRPLQPFDDLKTAVSAAQKRSAGMDIGSLGRGKGAKP